MENWEQEREKIIGLGNQSIRKSYYPILKTRLRELERFRQILDHSIDGIVVASLSSGKILDANRAASNLLCIPLNILQGGDFRELLRKHSDEHIRAFFDNSEDPTLKAHRVEIDRNGARITLELNMSRETIDSETIVVTVFRDITARVETEIKLKNARDEAQRANQAKSDFLAVVSHEMRTPLNPIMGFSQILKEVLEGTPEAEYIDHILKAANRQLELVDDILNYTAMDRGTMTGTWTEFNLYEACQNALTDIRGKADHLKLSIEYGTPGHPLSKNLHVTGEYTMLLRLLDNLLENACKYTPAGSVCLKVSEEKIDSVSSKFHFTISDTGIGMSPDIQESIFEAFTQADSTHKRNYEGIGLGLAICRKLVSYLGGEITCKSTPDVGSDFTFWLPMRIVASTENDPEVEVCESKQDQSYDDRLKVLIVEDREDNARLLEVILKKINIQVELQQNGKLAAGRCTEQQYDCILMDLSMPVMSGFEAAKAIRETGLNLSTPIIAITADVTPSVEQRCQEAGINAYLSKPIDPVALKNLIQDFSNNTAAQS